MSLLGCCLCQQDFHVLGGGMSAVGQGRTHYILVQIQLRGRLRNFFKSLSMILRDRDCGSDREVITHISDD